jgi:hypothetical protein
VKNPSPPKSSQHPDDLLLPYVEDMITPAEKTGIEEHLSTCRDCASRVEELRETILALRENKRAFCPELWELHDFARSGDDPHGVISTHVENCPFCSEDLRAWKRATEEERMPAELWNRLKERIPAPAPRQVPLETPRWYQVLLGNLARFWKMPALAAGAVAATLLLVVVFYSNDIMEPMAPKSKALPQKTAFVVLLKDFKAPALQKQIESVSEALGASSDLKDRYTIVSPKETSELIESGKVSSHDKSAMIDGLKRNLNVSRVLIITVFPSADEFAFRVELIDTIDGTTLQTKSDEKIEQNKLAEQVRSDALSMLLERNNQQ